MKKTFKIVGFILLVVIIIYTGFIIEESIRIEKGGEPLFKLKEYKRVYTQDSTINSIKCIGFRVDKEYLNKDNKLIKEEFWLFDKFLLWGWVS